MRLDGFFINQGASSRGGGSERDAPARRAARPPQGETIRERETGRGIYVMNANNTYCILE